MSSTRSRVVFATATVVALLGLVALARLWFSPEPTGDTVFAGTYTSDTDLRVANRSIIGGHMQLGYSLDVLFNSGPEPANLRCGLVDTSGTLDFFESSRTFAPSGEWSHLEFESTYELPKLTLGLRCSPSIDGTMSMVFRNVTLDVVELH